MVAAIDDATALFSADFYHESEVWPVTHHLIQFHAAGINRRLDALLELLETDKRKDGHDA
jgi:hypothetical protein